MQYLNDPSSPESATPSDCFKWNHHRAGSEASTSAGSCSRQESPSAFTWPSPISSQHFGAHLSSPRGLSWTPDRDSPSSRVPAETHYKKKAEIVASQEDVGALLLKAFQIRDDYIQLQQKYNASKIKAGKEINSLCSEVHYLRAELQAAQERNSILESELESCRFAKSALKLDLNVVKRSAARTLHGASASATKAASSRQFAKVFAAWRVQATASKACAEHAYRLCQTKNDSSLALLGCRVFCAWAMFVARSRLVTANTTSEASSGSRIKVSSGLRFSGGSQSPTSTIPKLPLSADVRTENISQPMPSCSKALAATASCQSPRTASKMSCPSRATSPRPSVQQTSSRIDSMQPAPSNTPLLASQQRFAGSPQIQASRMKSPAASTSFRPGQAQPMWSVSSVAAALHRS